MKDLDFPLSVFDKRTKWRLKRCICFAKLKSNIAKNYKNIFVSFSTKALAIMAIVRFNFGNIVHTNVHSETHEYIHIWFRIRCKCLTLIQNTCFEVLPFLKESFTFLKKIILMFNLLFTWQLTHTPKNLPLFWCL